MRYASICSGLAAAAAFGQSTALAEAPEASGQGWKADVQAVAAAGAIDETAKTKAADGPLFDIVAGVEGSTGVGEAGRLTWRGALRLERDAPARPGFAGVLGGCPAAVAGCPGVGGLAPISPATGLSAAGSFASLTPLRRGAFAAVETASLDLEGPWGEAIAGWDTGAAARLDARPPRVFAAVSTVSPTLDLTGLSLVRSRNDVTGPSPKVTYMSPRWLGLRLGASFTPRADTRGGDFDPAFSATGLARAKLENVWEGAASFAHRLGAEGPRLRAAVTATHADAGTMQTQFDDYNAWGAGLEAEQGAWTMGARWLSSNNSWRGGHGDYSAAEVGAVRETKQWRIGLEAGWARDDLQKQRGAAVTAGLVRKLNASADVGFGYTWAQARAPVATFGAVGAPTSFTVSSQRLSNGGLFVEFAVRK